jgi:diguanylate cyclase (GGDEF)-like protein
LSTPEHTDRDAETPGSPAPARNANGARARRGSDTRQRQALVVDDDPVLRLTIGRFVEKLGFSARLCADGASAVEAVRNDPPDVVLLDAAMPEMDGFSACAAIRDLPMGAKLPIIMITTYDDDVSVDRAFAVGANEYITKPVHWAVLRHRVDQLVRATRAEQALRDDHAFLQSLVNAIPDATIVCNSEGIVEWANKAASVACGFCSATAGQRLRFRDDVCDADDGRLAGDTLVADLSASLITAGHSTQRLLMQALTDVSTLYAELHARPLLGAHGVSRGMILRLQDVTERELERRRLHSEVTRFDELAHHDPLTGLANRRLFLRRLAEALEAAQGNDAVVAVLFLDLDGFKQVNDSLGHEVGDLVLRVVASRLRAGVRHTDTVARFGGDEFAVILRDCGNAGVVRRVGDELLQAVAAPMPRDQSRMDVTASIGAALYPTHAQSVSELMRLADAAMYQVKSTGKGALQLYQG